MANSSKVSKFRFPYSVPCFVATDWHMRNPGTNLLMSTKGLFCLVKMCWLILVDVRLNLYPREYTTLAQCNDLPGE
jgi:hypothetical protein